MTENTPRNSSDDEWGRRYIDPEIAASRKILLAEDNETNVSFTRDFLESCGYQVFVATNGKEVLQKVEEISPDLILMDIQMPHLNGIEATQLLRSDPRFATLPIIALTAFAMQGDRERFLDAGMNEYLSKPVSLRKLEQVLARFLDKPANGNIKP